MMHQSMERNIRRKQYGSTEAMLADCKWIVHNCIIFNSPSSKLTSIAKGLVKVTSLLFPAEQMFRFANMNCKRSRTALTAT